MGAKILGAKILGAKIVFRFLADLFAGQSCWKGLKLDIFRNGQSYHEFFYGESAILFCFDHSVIYRLRFFCLMQLLII